VGATFSAFSALPVPDTAASNDVPYWLSQLVAVLDTKLVLAATSTADRDSRYFSAPSGVICVVRDGTGTVLGVYVKTSNAGTSVWSTIWTAPVPQTPVNIPLSDGVQVANGKPPIAVYNPAANTWTFWGNVGFTNGTNIPTNTILGTVPAAVSLSTVQPYYEGIAPTSVGGTGSPSGGAKISFSVGGNIVIFLPSGVSPAWVGFDGIVLPGA
jgi:hypothetical protein